MTLEAILKNPAIWKGRQQHDGRESLPSGHAALDEALPGRGWPIGALTELMVANEGVGEFTLLLPALAALTRQQQWIALVAPPHIPYAPALGNAGVALDYLMVVKGDDDKRQKNSFWAAEQLLRSGVFSAVVLWLRASADERQQRRLQLAAEHGKAWGVCYRARAAAMNASPAGLRMILQRNGDGLHIDIIKNRGGRLRELTLAEPRDDAVTYLHKHRATA